MSSPSRSNLFSLRRMFRTNSNSEEGNNDDLKAREKVNKLIDKQLKKDKKRFMYTHRLQLIGLPNAGKSTLIKQMQVANKHYQDESVRKQVGCKIRDSLVRNVITFFHTLEPVEVQQDKENCQALKEYFFNFDLSSSQQEQNPSAELTEYLENFWQSPELKELWIKAGVGDQSLRNQTFFLNKLRTVLKPDYVPDFRDILMFYEPTKRGILETEFRLEEVNFVLFEFHGTKRIIMDNDVMAFIFLVDVSEFDMVTNEGTGMTNLREALFLFKCFWYEPQLKEKSVILLLNKQDLFEEKMCTKASSFHKYFPEYKEYRSKCRLPEREKRRQMTGHELEMTFCKMFLRDLFLQVTWLHRQTNGPHTKDFRHHCYVHFTNAIDSQEMGKLIYSSCRDILQREHLKMHEIL